MQMKDIIDLTLFIYTSLILKYY